MHSRLADLTAKDKAKKLLEKAKNELESFTYDMGDKLSQEIYEKCSTEEEREKLRVLLSEASDWLYEQEEDTKKEVRRQSQGRGLFRNMRLDENAGYKYFLLCT